MNKDPFQISQQSFIPIPQILGCWQQTNNLLKTQRQRPVQKRDHTSPLKSERTPRVTNKTTTDTNNSICRQRDSSGVKWCEGRWNKPTCSCSVMHWVLFCYLPLLLSSCVFPLGPELENSCLTQPAQTHYGGDVQENPNLSETIQQGKATVPKSTTWNETSNPGWTSGANQRAGSQAGTGV